MKKNPLSVYVYSAPLNSDATISHSLEGNSVVIKGSVTI